jgi:hypothetical protein
MQYGVSIFWGMTDARCRHLLETVAKPCELDPLTPSECGLPQLAPVPAVMTSRLLMALVCNMAPRTFVRHSQDKMPSPC